MKCIAYLEEIPRGEKIKHGDWYLNPFNKMVQRTKDDIKWGEKVGPNHLKHYRIYLMKREMQFTKIL
jgi:hypothetical protein